MPNATALRPAAAHRYAVSLVGAPVDEAEIGAKAASQMDLGRLGFRTPGGICLNATALHTHLRAIGEPLAADRLTELESASEVRRVLAERILSAPLAGDIAKALHCFLIEPVRGGANGNCYAVRPSPTGVGCRGRSPAGPQNAALGVPRQKVERALKALWASRWSGQAIAGLGPQRRDGGVTEMAVIVQQVVPARASAVVFTVNPATGARGEVSVNVAHGIGEPLISGLIAPDKFVVDKLTGAVKAIHRGTQNFMVAVQDDGSGLHTVDCPQRLTVTRHTLTDLVRRCIEVEKQFGYPVDVEAALVGNEWVFLQARPIAAEVG